jgi:predicted metal-dependent hydrolase
VNAMPKGIATTERTYRDAEDLKWAARQWAARIDVRLAEIHVREMRRKWASVSTGGRLTLGQDLLRLPRDLAEFIIVHELVHLLVPNHGKVFASFMHAYLPDWADRARRLRGTTPPPA